MEVRNHATGRRIPCSNFWPATVRLLTVRYLKGSVGVAGICSWRGGSRANSVLVGLSYCWLLGFVSWV